MEEQQPIRAVLLAASLGRTAEDCETSLGELERLLETAGGEAAFTVLQNRERPDPATYLGAGKCEEVAKLLEADPTVTLAVFDNELTPSRIR